MAEIWFWSYPKHQRAKINPTELEQIGSGGQGRIYKWKYKGRVYSIKTLDDFDVFNRAKNIRNALLKGNLPESISYRGLPVGGGFASGDELGFVTIEHVALLVFNYLEGTSLDAAVSPLSFQIDPILSPRRKKLAKMVLEIMVTLEDRGIVHADLYPDNFFLSNGRVYVLDLVEGAGIWHIKKGNWLWKPRVIGKVGIFPLPPGVTKGNFHPKHDVWIGISTFMMILGVYPFAFLKRGDQKILDILSKSAHYNDWPPFKTPPSVLRDTIGDLAGFHKVMAKFPKRFRQYLYSLYVLGYNEPNRRPSFKQFRESLRSWW